MTRRTGDGWPNLLLVGQHVEAPKRVSWARATGVMFGAGVVVCLLSALVIPAVVHAPAADAVVQIPVPVAEPLPTPAADLTPAEVALVRVTEPVWAAQAGDGSPASYSVPRVMQAGTVRVQLTGVEASHPNRPHEPAEELTQVFRFELIDALDGTVLGEAVVEGVDSPPAVLAELDGPRATYLRVSAQVTASGSCTGCGNEDDYYERPLWNRWNALLEYLRAG